ncbi:hypothetical protein ACFQU1_16390 [Chelatococcus sp. GCM10030263]|uniref:hypothetical protein n=1 Tax=Chelatococcus sp. GCM10030263 TaxID=3273387 RepID=UPI00361C3E68
MASYFQRRRERRRSRQRFEEIVAWIVVPMVVIMTWWVGTQLYGAFQEPARALIRDLTSGSGNNVP